MVPKYENKCKISWEHNTRTFSFQALCAFCEGEKAERIRERERESLCGPAVEQWPFPQLKTLWKSYQVSRSDTCKIQEIYIFSAAHRPLGFPRGKREAELGRDGRERVERGSFSRERGSFSRQRQSERASERSVCRFFLEAKSWMWLIYTRGKHIYILWESSKEPFIITETKSWIKLIATAQIWGSVDVSIQCESASPRKIISALFGR